MFGSMCVMMVLNVVFLKLLISALGYMPNGVAVLPWTLLIVGIARVARKIDSIVVRMGLNPAITGDGLGRGLPGMVAYAVVRGIGSSIVKAAGYFHHRKRHKQSFSWQRRFRSADKSPYAKFSTATAAGHGPRWARRRFRSCLLWPSGRFRAGWLCNARKRLRRSTAGCRPYIRSPRGRGLHRQRRCCPA